MSTAVVRTASTSPRSMVTDIMASLAPLHDAAAMVMREMGPGHSEAVYHSALLVELNARHIPYRSEVCCPFMFQSTCVGYGKADVVVNNVIVEIKVTAGVTAEAKLQVLKYVQSLGDLEGREFVGAVLVMDRVSGRALLQAFDADGDEVYQGRPIPAEETSTPEQVLDDALMRAFRTKYKFVARPATCRGVRMHRLVEHLRRTAGLTVSDETDRCILRFLRDHFEMRTESHCARRTGSRRITMCYPLDGSGVILV